MDRIWLFDLPKKLHAAFLVHLFVYLKALIRLFVIFTIFSWLLLLELNICCLLSLGRLNLPHVSLPLLFSQKDSIFVLLVSFFLVPRNRGSFRNGGSFSQVPLFYDHYSLKLIDSFTSLHKFRLLRFELLVPFFPHIFYFTTQYALYLILQFFFL